MLSATLDAPLGGTVEVSGGVRGRYIEIGTDNNDSSAHDVVAALEIPTTPAPGPARLPETGAAAGKLGIAGWRLRRYGR